MKLFIELFDQWGVTVGKENLHSSLHQFSEGVRQFLLIFQAEVLLGIRGEAGGGVQGHIGRVEIDQISFFRFRDSILEASQGNSGPPKSLRGCPQTLLVADEGVLVAAHRDVELPLLVDSVQSVEASAVEVEQAGGSKNGLSRALLADAVVVVVTVTSLVLGQFADQFLAVGLKHRVEIVKLRIDIIEHHVLTLKKTLFVEPKENGTSPHERLKIGTKFGGEVLFVLFQESPLASGPF